MSNFTPLASNLKDGLGLFGFDALRPGQNRPVEHALSGKDGLVVMPTGSGKSLCFQLPAVMADGVTIVVSPLIALMKDQVDFLTKLNIPATFINSSISSSEQNSRIAGMKNGSNRIVYVAPERFRSSRFREALQGTPIRLLAIDEAHCISEWGHDFRPDYRTLKSFREQIGSPPTLALTATATPDVQSDILVALGIDGADVFVSGFERENLSFEIAQTRSVKDKFARMISLINHHKGESVVIYCATRKQVEQVQTELKKQLIHCGIYHGGLNASERVRQQEDWIQGKVPVLIATNAFGMGVDKSDVRAVIHFNMPGSLEAYYQEAGRAGRDGEPSNCLLLFNFADKGIHEFFSENSFPARKTTERIWDFIRGTGVGVHRADFNAIAKKTSTKGNRVHPMGVETVLRSLQFAGHLETGTQDGTKTINVLNTDNANIDWSHNNTRRKIAERQLKDVIQYANQPRCRQAHIVRYFGAKPVFGDRCGVCDFCAGPPEYAAKYAEENRRVVTAKDEPLTVVRKVLAGIARAKGRRGAHAVAGMLVGSRAKKIKEAKLDTLSTHGILRDMNKDDIVYVIDLCTQFGWVSRDEHGCVRIVDEGSKVMRQEEPPSEFATRTLDETIVTGAKVRRSNRGTNGDSKSGTSETFEETLRMFNDGMSYKEIAKSRDLTTSTVLRHLQKLALAGNEIDVSDEIDPDFLRHVRNATAGWKFGDPERPIIEQLEDCSYTKLRLHLIPILAERAN